MPLGQYVLEEACASVVARSDTLMVQVNLSAIELENPDLIQTITDVLTRTGIAAGPAGAGSHRDAARQGRRARRPNAAAAARPGRAARAGRLRDGLLARCRYLRNLPLDTLKIAREFVEGLAFSDHDAAFVRLIVGLAKTVGLKVVAEGIETRAQLDMLREIGCDLGQGYYFAAPMDVDADWLGAPAAAAALT